MSRLKIALVAAMLVACADGTVTKPQPVPDQPAPVATVELSHQQYSLNVGEAATLAVTVRDAGGRELLGRAVAWVSDAAQVATIAADGRISGIAPGTARIIATSEGKSDTTVVTVLAPVPVDTVVATVALSQSALVLETRDITALTATAKDAHGIVLTRPVSWMTSNASVATVASDGTVAARGVGAAIIFATVEGITASANVVVGNRPAFDLVYQRSVPDTNQIYTLSLSTPAAQPQYVNAGSVSYRPSASPGGQRIAFAVHMFLNGVNVEDIYAVDRIGGTNIKRLTQSDGADESPSIAPDGSGRIAYVHVDPASGRQDIWMMASDGTGQHAITGSEPLTELRGSPSWSPDGQWIAYSAAKPFGSPDRGSIWIARADGSGKRRITSSAGFDTSPTWSPDGRRIAFSRAGDINIVDVATGDVTVLALPGSQVSPAWSPDGQHFAFAMRDPLNDTGNFQIFTVRVDGSDLRLRVRDTSSPFASAVSPSWIR